MCREGYIFSTRNFALERKEAKKQEMRSITQSKNPFLALKSWFPRQSMKKQTCQVLDGSITTDFDFGLFMFLLIVILGWVSPSVKAIDPYMNMLVIVIET